MFAGLPFLWPFRAGPTPPLGHWRRAMGACPQGVMHTCPQLPVDNSNCNALILLNLCIT